MNGPRATTTEPAEERLIQRSQRSLNSSENEGRKRGEKLVHIPARLIPEDAATLTEIAEEHLREPSYIIRLAVHMFCEAYRRNPRALQ